MLIVALISILHRVQKIKMPLYFYF